MHRNYEAIESSLPAGQFHAAPFSALDLLSENYQVRREKPTQETDEEKIARLRKEAQRAETDKDREVLLSSALDLARKAFGHDFAKRPDCADLLLGYAGTAYRLGLETSAIEKVKESRQIFLSNGMEAPAALALSMEARMTPGANGHFLTQRATVAVEKLVAESTNESEKRQYKETLKWLYSSQLSQLARLNRSETDEFRILAEKSNQLGSPSPISSCELADIKANSKSEALNSVVGEFKERYAKLKSALDTERNGTVSLAEIDQAMKSQQIRGNDAVLVNAMKDVYQGISTLDNKEGISGADMDQLNQIYERAKGKPSNKDWELVLDRVNRSADASKRKIESSPKQLAKSEKAWTEEAIAQGVGGDCLFLSFVAGLAASNPEAVKKMIQPSKDGSFKVTFPGMPDNPTIVPPITDSEIGQYASGDLGYWPIVLQKAWGALNLKASNLDPNNYSAADAASSRQNAIVRALTGKEEKLVSVAAKRNQPDGAASISELLDSKLASGSPVVASIGAADTCKTDLPLMHAYTVLSFDKQKATVTLRNPWGKVEPGSRSGLARDGKDDGVFTMTLSEFMNTFRDLKFAGD